MATCRLDAWLGQTGTQPVTVRCAAAAVIAIAWLNLCGSSQKNGSFSSLTDSYSAAVYLSGNFRGVQRLLVFPLRGARFEIPLPFDLWCLSYGPDGKVLYGASAMIRPPNAERPGFFKVEFNPTRVTLLPGSLELSAKSIAVSRIQDKIIFSGKGGSGTKAPCGVFELSLASGNLRSVVQQLDCQPSTSWTDLTLSPDGEYALGIQQHALKLLHLADGTTKSLGDGFVVASWSPNGRWIAARGNRGPMDATLLLDGKSYSVLRKLPTSTTQWSPDSRYLLAYRPRLLCGLYAGTLETIDVETGKRSALANSRCQIDEFMGAVGWVSTETGGLHH